MDYGNIEHYGTTSPYAIPAWQNDMVIVCYVVIYALILFGLCKLVYRLFRYFFGKKEQESTELNINSGECYIVDTNGIPNQNIDVFPTINDLNLSKLRAQLRNEIDEIKYLLRRLNEERRNFNFSYAQNGSQNDYSFNIHSDLKSSIEKAKALLIYAETKNIEYYRLLIAKAEKKTDFSLKKILILCLGCLVAYCLLFFLNTHE